MLQQPSKAKPPSLMSSLCKRELKVIALDWAGAFPQEETRYWQAALLWYIWITCLPCRTARARKRVSWEGQLNFTTSCHAFFSAACEKGEGGHAVGTRSIDVSMVGDKGLQNLLAAAAAYCTHQWRLMADARKETKWQKSNCVILLQGTQNLLKASKPQRSC